MNLYTRALMFAAEAHGDQLQKYTGAPYILHPIRVAETVRKVVVGHIYGEAAIAAALLHDVVEDCAVPIQMIEYEFGIDVECYVNWLTDPVEKPAVEGGPNRAKRKAAVRDRLAQAPALAQTIKVADLLDNTSSIVQHDPKFAVTYLREKVALLDVLEKADPALRSEAYQTVDFAMRDLSAKGYHA